MSRIDDHQTTPTTLQKLTTHDHLMDIPLHVNLVVGSDLGRLRESYQNSHKVAAHSPITQTHSRASVVTIRLMQNTSRLNMP